MVWAVVRSVHLVRAGRRSLTAFTAILRFRRLHANPSDYTYDQSVLSPHPYLDSRSWVVAWGSLVRVPFRVPSRAL